MEKHINILRSDRIRKKGGQFHPPHYSKCWDVKLILIDEHNFHISLYFLFSNFVLYKGFPIWNDERISNRLASILFFWRCVWLSEWVTPQTLDLKVWDSSLTHRVVFLDKELYSTLSLFNQVFKWLRVTCWWGLALTLRWTSILFKWRGE